MTIDVWLPDIRMPYDLPNVKRAKGSVALFEMIKPSWPTTNDPREEVSAVSMCRAVETPASGSAGAVKAREEN